MMRRCGHTRVSPVHQAHSAKVSTSPLVRSRTGDKHRTKRLPHSNAPPIPPRPLLAHCREPSSAPSLSWLPHIDRRCDPQVDSDSDFEDSEVVHKIRYSAQTGSLPALSSAKITTSRVNSVSDEVTQPSTTTIPVQTLSTSAVTTSVDEKLQKKKLSMRRSRSVDCLDTSGKSSFGMNGSTSSRESDIYSLPFQHLEKWRKRIGVKDSSVVTGSLPCLDIDDTFVYIDPNQFRSIVTHVRGDSVKMGSSDVCERAMRRVDSVIRSHRSRAMSNVCSREIYLSLVGGDVEDKDDSLSWLRKFQSDDHTLTPPTKQELLATDTLPQHTSTSKVTPARSTVTTATLPPVSSSSVGVSGRHALGYDVTDGVSTAPPSFHTAHHRPHPQHMQHSTRSRELSAPILPLLSNKTGKPPVPPRLTRPHPLPKHRTLQCTQSAGTVAWGAGSRTVPHAASRVTTTHSREGEHERSSRQSDSGAHARPALVSYTYTHTHQYRMWFTECVSLFCTCDILYICDFWS